MPNDLGMDPGSALEEKEDQLISEGGGVWVTWSFGWKVTVSKGRPCPSSSSWRSRVWRLYLQEAETRR